MGIQNKLLTETIIVIHSEKEVFVVKNTRNIKENIENLSEAAPLDGILLKSAEIKNGDFIFLLIIFHCNLLTFSGILIHCLSLILKQSLI